MKKLLYCAGAAVIFVVAIGLMYLFFFGIMLQQEDTFSELSIHVRAAWFLTCFMTFFIAPAALVTAIYLIIKGLGE